MPNHRPLALLLFRTAAVILVLAAAGCTPPPESATSTLAVRMPLHLEEHLEAARVEGPSAAPAATEALEWRFDEPQPDWRPYDHPWPEVEPVAVDRADGALRLTLTDANRYGRLLTGWIFVDLPGLKPEDWAYVVVRARTADQLRYLMVCFDHPQDRPGLDYPSFLNLSRLVRPVDDGEVHGYTMELGTTEGSLDTWQRLGIQVGAEDPATIDVVSVTLLPSVAAFTAVPAGVTTEARHGEYRRVLYLHSPGRIEYRLRVPAGGRLDFGLGVLRAEPPVTFRVAAAAGDRTETLFDESYEDRIDWAQRSVDLAAWAGRTITLTLAAHSDGTGNVALWAAPTVSGRRAVEAPNVIVYVIDGGAAEYMSVYGYNRRTTPHLERLAAAGATFVNAYSNAAWTKPSSMSFMTSLTNGMLGGHRDPGDPLPARAVPMAELLHAAGYQTAHFTANPYCGTLSSLERGTDATRETITEGNSVSSRRLHELFWQWRQDYPGEPYWVHFQTVDVHPPLEQVDPFAGLYLSQKRRETFAAAELRLRETARARAAEAAEEDEDEDEDEEQDESKRERMFFQRAEVDPYAYYQAARDGYDEAMAHNDYQLGKLVARLRATGQWERTLLIVAADHGWDHLLGLMRLRSALPREVNLNPFITRVPMIFVWPQRIAAGQRFEQPVSMLDLLPTVLDLVGQPQPEHLAGQSLAPLLLGRGEWEPQPVIIEEIRIKPKDGERWGFIEAIDGRWGASLKIGTWPGDEEEEEKESPQQAAAEEEAAPSEKAPVEEEDEKEKEKEEKDRILVFDLWNDPYTRRPINEERPDLVEKYRDFLEKRFREHQEVAKQFPREDQVALRNEQLEQLRSLGYLQ